MSDRGEGANRRERDNVERESVCVYACDKRKIRHRGFEEEEGDIRRHRERQKE